MTPRIVPRWWWLTLSGRTARIVPVVVVALAWLALGAGWIKSDLFAAIVLMAVGELLFAVGVHLVLIGRRALVRRSAR